MKKRLVSLMLAGLLTLSLPACGGQNDGKFCEYCGAPRG